MRHGRVAFFGLRSIVPFVLIGPALAADPSSETPNAAEPVAASVDRLAFVGQKLSEWKVVLGGGAMMVPKYEGSDEFDIQPVPFVTATFGEHVKVDPRGVSVNVYSFGNLNLSAQLGYDTGRKQKDSDHLRGLGDIDAGGVVGGTLAYELGPAEFYASLSRIVGGSDGLEAKIGFDLAHQIDQFRFSVGASATWADENYMESYFGVTAAQSAASGLKQYDIGAGFKRVDLDLAVTYMASEHWLVRGQVGIGYLLGDAADSPVVQEAFQPSGMLTLGYRF
ncbi:MipA/OmpV family protein [Bosea sp. 117]|uniref:MipA/OmpV family protein n=1 Tax=Bosea sp. 117 TaxID=1125973 RepID=UPI0004948F94|nr:MipA/OmpV family protein [Bosea sp. 117]